MVPIALCSIATLYLIGDGTLRTSPKRVAPPEQEQKVKELFRNGDYVGAYKYCKENRSPLSNVLRVGIGLLGDGKQVAEEGMLAELAKENSTMQTYISYLSVIGVCAPMIGLLGTVTGMIRAFATLGESGIGEGTRAVLRGRSSEGAFQMANLDREECTARSSTGYRVQRLRGVGGKLSQ